MPGGAVLAQIQIELVLIHLHAQFLHTGQQFVVIIFPLTAADNFPDTGHQAVHSRHGFSVRVLLHIEGLDFLGIIRHKHRPLENLLREKTLVLRLEIRAPAHFIFKLIVVLFQKRYRFGIAHPAEIRLHHVGETLNQPLIHKVVQKGHFRRRIVHHIADHIFQHVLRQPHIVLQIAKGKFRLNLPEFRRMAGGIGMLRPEGRAKSINVAKSLGKGLSVQLPAHR